VGSGHDRAVFKCFLHEKDIDAVAAKKRCRQSLADCKPASKRSIPITLGSRAQSFFECLHCLLAAFLNAYNEVVDRA
jgi:hypothetical protein